MSEDVKESKEVPSVVEQPPAEETILKLRNMLGMGNKGSTSSTDAQPSKGVSSIRRRFQSVVLGVLDPDGQANISNGTLRQVIDENARLQRQVQLTKHNCDEAQKSLAMKEDVFTQQAERAREYENTIETLTGRLNQTLKVLSSLREEEGDAAEAFASLRSQVIELEDLNSGLEKELQKRDAEMNSLTKIILRHPASQRLSQAQRRLPLKDLIECLLHSAAKCVTRVGSFPKLTKFDGPSQTKPEPVAESSAATTDTGAQTDQHQEDPTVDDSKVESLRSECEALSSELSTLVGKRGDFQTKITELGKDIASHQKDFDEVQKRLTAAKEAEKKSEEARRVTEEAVGKLNLELDAIKAEIGFLSEKKSAILKVRRTVQQNAQDDTMVTDKLRQLALSLGIHDAPIAPSLESSFGMISGAVKRLQQKLDEVESKLQAVGEQEVASGTTQDDSRKELKGMQTQQVDERLAVSECREKKLQRLLSKVRPSSEEDSIDALETWIAKLESDVAKGSELNESLRVLLEEERQRVLEVQRECESVVAEVSEFSDILEKKDVEISSLSTQLGSATEALDTAKASLAEKDEELSEERNLALLLESNLRKELQQMLHVVDDQKAQHAAIMECVRSDHKSLHRARRELQQTLEDRERTMSDMESEINMLRFKKKWVETEFDLHKRGQRPTPDEIGKVVADALPTPGVDFGNGFDENVSHKLERFTPLPKPWEPKGEPKQTTIGGEEAQTHAQHNGQVQ